MRGKQSREQSTANPSVSESNDAARAVWQAVLVDGNERLRRAQRLFRHLPSAPRCKMCHNPFAGVGGKVVGLAGFKPSRKNPNLCARCCEKLPPGGLELDVAVMFADVRGSTALGERMGAAPFADLLNRFYRIATDVLVRHDALIDKLLGDEVMALFVPGIAGDSYRRKAAAAATELVEVLSGELALPVGAAVNAGRAFMGNIGAGHVVDLTAVGDPVNTAARLQEWAGAGEIVISDDVYVEISDRFLDAEPTTLSIRGREAPMAVHVVRVPA
jgi:adenylate cyclase